MCILFVLHSDYQLLIFTLAVFMTIIQLIYRADPRKEKKIKRLCVNFWRNIFATPRPSLEIFLSQSLQSFHLIHPYLLSCSRFSFLNPPLPPPPSSCHSAAAASPVFTLGLASHHRPSLASPTGPTPAALTTARLYDGAREHAKDFYIENKFIVFRRHVSG